jgi:Putative peptidoglycan binding domain
MRWPTHSSLGDLETWAGIENLEERVEGAARIDPVVLAELRRLAANRADATKPHTQEERDG